MGSNAAHRFDNNLRRRPEGHPNQIHLTPPYILEPARKALGGHIGLDPCTLPDNPTGAVSFYCPPQDGCALPWDASTIFVNPPYGEARERWAEKCIQAGDCASILLLIPSHTDTKIVQRLLGNSHGALYVKGRVKFGVLRPNRRQQAASHPSVIFGWNVDWSHLKHLGTVMIPLSLNNLEEQCTSK